jgi:outer membrane protein
MKWLIVCALVLFTAPVFAQAPAAAPAGTGGIAVIDVQKVVSNSEVGKKALAEIKTIKDKKQSEIDQRQNALQTMQDKLEKEKDILSPDAQEKRRDEINKAFTDLKRFREDSEQEIQNRLGGALKGMEDQVLPIIQKLGTDKGYSLIVSRDQLIYYSAKIDITDEVIRLFNEKAGPVPQTQEKK